MATVYKIDIDVKDVEKKLEQTSLHVEKVVRKILRTANSQVIKTAKNTARSLFKSFNNENDSHNPSILKSFSQYVLYKDDSFAAWIHDRTLHAAVMEKGAKINPVKGEYLFFKIDGQWKKVKGVSIPARPFVKPAFDNVYNSANMNELIKTELDKQLDKFWN